MAESFDAALASGRKLCADYDSIGAGHAAQPIRELLDRLQSAHEAEVAELRKQLQFWKDSSDDVHNLWQEDKDRADRVVGMLRECQPYVSSMAQASHLTDGFSPKPANAHDEMAARLTAFLSEQAGERENGDG